MKNINRKTFPLPTLGPKLQTLCNNVHSGNGFAIIKGMEPETPCTKDTLIEYLGLASYFGEQRGRQNLSGEIVGEVLRSPIDE